MVEAKGCPTRLRQGQGIIIIIGATLTIGITKTLGLTMTMGLIVAQRHPVIQVS
jgi:hypothetical protein